MQCDLVEKTVEVTHAGDTPAVGEALELKAFFGSKDADCSVLDAVESGQLCVRSPTPYGAQVLKPAPDVRLVDGGEGSVGRERTVLDNIEKGVEKDEEKD